MKKTLKINLKLKELEYFFDGSANKRNGNRIVFLNLAN